MFVYVCVKLELPYQKKNLVEVQVALAAISLREPPRISCSRLLSAPVNTINEKCVC